MHSPPELKYPNKWNSTRLVIAILCIIYITWATWLAYIKDWNDVVISALYAIAAVGGGYIGLNTLSRGGMGNMMGGMGNQAINIINQQRYKSLSPDFEDESDPHETPL
jgi:hypothetical protein